MRATRLSFHKEKQETIIIDSRNKAGHGRERRGKMEQKKKMGGKGPREYPSWLRTVPRGPPLCSLWDSPVFHSKGNCGHRGSYLQGQRGALWFVEKGRVCFPLWTPNHCQAMLSPPPPVFLYFSLLIYNSKGIGRVVSERSEILKNKLTICHSFENRSGSCGFSHFYFIIVQHRFMECLPGSDYVPGALP